jgi:hypothetical protein
MIARLLGEVVEESLKVLKAHRDFDQYWERWPSG